MQNDFEKQVRQKMDELHFVPGEPVWTKIEEQIRTKKDRRRLLLWLPLMLLFLAGGVLWVNNGGMDKTSGLTAAGKPLPETVAGNKKPAAGIETGKKTEVEERLQKEDPITTNTAADINGREQKKTLAEAAGIKANQTSVSAIRRNGLPKQDPTNQQNENSLLVAEDKKAGQEGVQQQAKAPLISKEAREQAHPQLINAPTVPEEKLNTSAEVQPTAPVKDSAEAFESEKKPVRKKDSKWKMAIAAQGGLAGLGSTLSFGTEKEMMDLNSSPSSPFVSPSQGPAEIVHGAFFSAAVQVKKKLHERWNFAAGLGYSFYGNTMKLGADSFSVSSGVNYYFSRTPGSYNTYNNRYHFISLPLSLEWKVSGSLPISWEAGVMASRLIATNALVYNRQFNLYAEDKGSIQKNQLFFTTGINYGFHMKGMSLQIGPQLQYGMNSIEKNNSNKHLYALGIKTQLVFR